jgi:hypothetical protein
MFGFSKINEIIADYPEYKLIATTNIPNLKVVSLNGVEIKGQAVNIEGMTGSFFNLQSTRDIEINRIVQQTPVFLAKFE